MICGAARCGVNFWLQFCGAVQCGVTNKKFLRAADTKFCIRDITSVIPDALSRAPCRNPEPEDVINVNTTKMIRKNVSAILRGKDQEVTAETFSSIQC